MTKKRWMEYALSKGFDSFEIYQSIAEERTVNWYEGTMESFVTSHVLGTSLRGLIGGKMANLATENADDDQMEKLIDQMITQSEAITSDEVGVIRHPQETEKVADTHRWVKPSGEQIQQTLASLEEAIRKADPRVIQVTGLTWTETVSRREITNTYGMQVEDEARYQILMAGAAAQQGEEIKNHYHVQVVEDLSKLNLQEFVNHLMERLLAKLGAVSLSSGNYPVIFKNSAMEALFSAFSGMFSGDLIFKGISPLKDKLNEQIFDSKVTVTDDPRRTDTMALANFDDEGCPTYRKTVVDKGVFKTILHSSKSAMSMKSESTGNGFKSGYASPVHVAAYNCCIEPGEDSLDQLCKEMGEGLVITSLQGLHAGLDFVTTDFSLQCSGYWVKDGKEDHSVSLITVAGNYLDLMKHVVRVGNDLEWEYHTIACPSIWFESCAISGE